MVGSIHTCNGEEMDCGGSFLDNIEDLPELPMNYEDMEDDLSGKFVWSTDHSGGVYHEIPNHELSYEDIVQQGWLSNIGVHPFSGGGSLADNSSSQDSDPDPSKDKPLPLIHPRFHTTSPVSVLYSSSDSKPSHAGSSPHPTGPKVKARSKRPRHAVQQIISPWMEVSSLADSDSHDESWQATVKTSEQLLAHRPKKKKNKIKQVGSSGQGLRKCLHCEITKTPQWRAGPLGPKTLCNACGVRYKSGRLFPEYRPAASPTFVPAVHSNSHKKVLEIRCKIGQAMDGVLA
ncbi:hypothetical protein SAY86_030349 [Trapa natans]|uniref:GATA-type domain-containing protein n=1 Tax=Trapa natans TaxID=22666 RepID=A0AAN7MRE6_TRANT|nr:hypothetical protein SAY86_030349 [Trapa natans]